MLGGGGRGKLFNIDIFTLTRCNNEDVCRDDEMSVEAIVGSIFGGIVCLGVAVGGGYVIGKCIKKCLPTPNTPDLEAPETPEEVGGSPKKPLKTIKALLEPVLRTKVKEEPMEEPLEDPVDPPMDPVDPTVQVDPTDAISTASTASYKSIIG